MVYSCSTDCKVKAWSITNKQMKYEFAHQHYVCDIVIGRAGTPLENRIVSVGADKTCRISNLETGAELKKLCFDGWCRSISVDKAQTVIAIGTGENVTLFESTSFTKIKELCLKPVNSVAFNQRNDCLLAVTYGEVHCIKF